jgi:DNA (cytosine-5)-methyltransferase 1
VVSVSASRRLGRFLTHCGGPVDASPRPSATKPTRRGFAANKKNEKRNVAVATKKTWANADDGRILELLAAECEFSAYISACRLAAKPARSTSLSRRANAVLLRLGLLDRSTNFDNPEASQLLERHARKICSPKPKCNACPLISFCETGIRKLARLPKTLPIVVDLFGGAGGMGFGFRNARYRVGLAVEWNRDAAQSYRINNPGVPVLERDVGKLKPDDVRRIIGRRPDVVCAGPPCQSYSLAGGRADEDPRHHLFRHVLSLARKLRPAMIVIENVPGVARTIGEDTYKDIITRAIGRQFDVEVLLLDATHYGVPQTRRRYFFIGRPKGSPAVGKPRATHDPTGSSGVRRTPTVWDTLRTLPPRNHGSRSDVIVRRNGQVVRNLSTMLHSPRVLRKIKKIKPGEGPMSYRRLQKTFARTIVAGHRALAVHPTRHRTLSVREAALLQGFPESYSFLGARANTPIQVANAVPPPLAKAIARHIRPTLVKRGAR